MNLETTTCMSPEHLQIIKTHALKHNVSLRSFIVGIINYVISHKTIPVKVYSRLSYRPRDGAWMRFHLVLIEHEYEFLLDVKKVYKMSLAKVIAYCIDNYLFDFLKALSDEDNTDNYRCSGYTFQFYLEEGIQCCQFYWGPHPRTMKKILNSQHNT